MSHNPARKLVCLQYEKRKSRARCQRVSLKVVLCICMIIILFSPWSSLIDVNSVWEARNPAGGNRYPLSTCVMKLVMKKRMIIVHSLPWRSKSKTRMLHTVYYTCNHLPVHVCTELNEFLHVLDKREEEHRQAAKHYAAERKKMRTWQLASSIPPMCAPKWAVDKEWRKGQWNAWGLYIACLCFMETGHILYFSHNSVCILLHHFTSTPHNFTPWKWINLHVFLLCTFRWCNPARGWTWQD